MTSKEPCEAKYTRLQLTVATITNFEHSLKQRPSTEKQVSCVSTRLMFLRNARVNVYCHEFHLSSLS